MKQLIISSANEYQDLDKWLYENRCRKLMLVCDDSIKYMNVFFDHLQVLIKDGLQIEYFRGFQPNPLYENIVSGVRGFREKRCDSIIAVGGGSAIDVAKCIKLFSNMEGDGTKGSFLKTEIVPNDIPFIAMPTTAGTGSEATRYAVIYYHGEKQSITSENCIPQAVLMDANALKTLPLYQRKSTMMDAFCHAIESYWSVNSTEESREYSHQAITLILRHMDGYLCNTESGNAGMLAAANIAGKAINITQTTAGHAMCYKLTSLFGIAHGHAAILCVKELFPWMIENLQNCTDDRGKDYLKHIFFKIAANMGCDTPEEAAEKLDSIFEDMELTVPSADKKQFDLLRNSVNPTRLRNNPIALKSEDIDCLYHRILSGEKYEG